METLDIYASPPPNRSTENGSASLTSRLVWCGIQYMGRQLFYAHELGLLIEDIYGEKCSSNRVAAALKSLSGLRYVTRVQVDDRFQTYYRYRVSELGLQYIRRHSKEAVGVRKEMQKEEQA